MKTIIRLIAGIATTLYLCIGPVANAQTAFPNRPVRILLGSAAGGPIDVVLRGAAEKLSNIWGQPVIVDNRPGANQNIAMDVLAHSAPDGYTIGMFDNSGLASNMYLYSKLPFDPVNDMVPITRIFQFSLAVLVKGDMPANNLKEFVALMKRDGKKYNYGSTGDGGVIHIGFENWKRIAQFDIVHVPYKGIAPVMQDMLNGSVDATLAVASAAVPYLASKRVKVLAIAAPKRAVILPDVPTAAEAGYPEATLNTYYGFVAPKGTPPDIVTKIQESVRQVLADKAFLDKSILPYAYVPIGDTPRQFAAQLKEDRTEAEKSIRAVGVKLD